MGYTTDFTGALTLDKPLKLAHANFLSALNATRRMQRDAVKAARRPDPIRKAAGLPIGNEGEYFVGDEDPMGLRGPDVINHNASPSTQPGLWCQWTPGDKRGIPFFDKPIDEGEAITIVWDEGEKFYCYKEWITYIVDHFLKPWGYVLNGEVKWAGEESEDIGKIIVKDNVITIHEGKILYQDVPTSEDDDEAIQEAIQQMMKFTERKRCPKYIREAARKIARLSKA